MFTIHATHNIGPEYAGNARLEVDGTSDSRGVSLLLDTLQEGEAEVLADLTPQEAQALALALTEHAAEALEHQALDAEATQ